LDEVNPDQPSLDHFERASMFNGKDNGSIAYYNWFAYEFWRFVFVQQEVAKAAQSLFEFPPTQSGIWPMCRRRRRLPEWHICQLSPQSGSRAEGARIAAGEVVVAEQSSESTQIMIYWPVWGRRSWFALKARGLRVRNRRPF
jgi:hypothetical protein